MTDDQLTDDLVDILEVGETCSLAIVIRRGCGVCAWAGKSPFLPGMSCLPATTLPPLFFKLRKNYKPVVIYLNNSCLSEVMALLMFLQVNKSIYVYTSHMYICGVSLWFRYVIHIMDSLFFKIQVEYYASFCSTCFSPANITYILNISLYCSL